MNKEIKYPEMAAAVIWWLNYLNAIGRGYVINENAIKYPVAEYLEKSIIEKKKIQLERNHPILWKRKIDVCYEKNGEEIAFEFKYIKEGSTVKQSERQRVFNDLMRLHYFLAGGGSKAYFLICGNKTEFKNSFMKIPIPADPKKPMTPVTYDLFYENWFSFSDSPDEVLIDLTINDNVYAPMYANFFKNYKPKKGKIMKRPTQIKTRMIFVSQEYNDSNIPENLRIGVWEIFN